jgi:uncharacterized protein (DUF433 family)
MNYVEQRDGGYWVAGTRVSLDSIVYAFHAGQTAESMAHMFPVLSLEQVYGAVAYYLARCVEVDEYLMKAKKYNSISAPIIGNTANRASLELPPATTARIPDSVRASVRLRPRSCLCGGRSLRLGLS